VLDRQRRQVGVVHEVATNARQDQQLTENFGMPFGRPWNPRGVGREPSGYLSPGILH